ncbi:MAG: exodeoxyribonuclease VII small subunit [Candidatus Binataceae bacterium]|nr:exodeoxyribonuclease VII small subunit [Candidatus Binataceae bacterium]
MAPAKAKKFEEEMNDLEQIVSRIDSGELSLEDSIEAFERGVALVRSLNQKLDDIERKVEVLVKSAQGDLKSVPYESPAGESTNQSGEDSSISHTDKDDDIPF